MEGKEEFYKKAEEALKRSGYQYYGEKEIIGSNCVISPRAVWPGHFSSINNELAIHFKIIIAITKS